MNFPDKSYISPIDSVELVFLDLVSEANGYFAFLSKLINNDSRLYLARDNEKEEIEPSIRHTLKATSFLILYNLVESTVQNILSAIHQEISGASFDELSDKLKIYILQEFRKLEINIEKFPFGKPIGEIIHEVTMEKHKPFSGNLDAKRIRSITEKYTINFRSSPEARNGEKLKSIKDQRNILAHGDKSFIEVGKDTSIDDLLLMKDEVVCFLQDFIKCTRSFLEDRQYIMINVGQKTDQ